jgi:hypothetical protein
MRPASLLHLRAARPKALVQQVAQQQPSQNRLVVRAGRSWHHRRAVRVLDRIEQAYVRQLERRLLEGVGGVAAEAGACVAITDMRADATIAASTLK